MNGDSRERPAQFYKSEQRMALTEKDYEKLTKLEKDWLGNFKLFGQNLYPLPLVHQRFMISRKFELDFAWPSPLMICVEVEGGQWGVKCKRCGGTGEVLNKTGSWVESCPVCFGKKRTAGGHTSGTGLARDCEKNNYAVLHGWKMFRFTVSMIEESKYYKPLFEMLPVIR